MLVWLGSVRIRCRGRARSRAWYAKARQMETHKHWERFYIWCFRYDWVRNQLPWKTYKPRLYSERVEHHCMRCQFTQRQGFKLWWCRTSDSSDRLEYATGLRDLSADEQYLCSTCYRKTENIIPQGFEDITSLKDFKARAGELGINTDK